MFIVTYYLPGCGTSAWCELLEQRFTGRVTHFDASLKALEALEKRMPGKQLICGDLTSLPFKHRSFDCVVDKGLYLPPDYDGDHAYFMSL